MDKPITDILSEIIARTPTTPDVRTRHTERLAQGRPTRDEDPDTHFCVYFLPFNPGTGEVFLVHHRKANLWISPGGHIDAGETPLETLGREAREELGLPYNPPRNEQPFLLTITEIRTPSHPCRRHYDIWYLICTDGDGFVVDPAEFYETRWVGLPEALELVSDPNNCQALAEVQRRFAPSG